MIIRIAAVEDIPSIIHIAHATWWHTYESFISKEQLDYMFGQAYTPERLYQQMTFMGHIFFLLEEEGREVAYASVAPRPEDATCFKLHKLYARPETQGKGYGAALMKYAEEFSRSKGALRLELNVNRENKAQSFYKRMGYEIVLEEDIPIGEYFMNDYVMGKKL